MYFRVKVIIENLGGSGCFVLVGRTGGSDLNFRRWPTSPTRFTRFTRPQPSLGLSSSPADTRSLPQPTTVLTRRTLSH